MLRRCENCEWWKSDGSKHGRCRALPPTMDNGMPCWPLTRMDDWCGAFRLCEAMAGGKDVRAARGQ